MNDIVENVRKFSIGVRVSLFNHELREARLRAGFKTQRAAAEFIGIQTHYYNAVEAMRVYPGIDRAKRISDAFNMEVEVLFPEVLEHVTKKRKRQIIFKKDLYYREDNGRFVTDLEENEHLQIQNKAVDEALSCLTERERTIVLARFYESKTLEEVSSMLSLSRERVRQLEVRALRKMKRPVEKQGVSKDDL